MTRGHYQYLEMLWSFFFLSLILASYLQNLHQIVHRRSLNYKVLRNGFRTKMNKIDSYLDFHAQALKLRSRRNEVLASNIANAATPNFKARDLDFDAEIRHHIGAGPLRTTDDQHLPTMVNPVRDRMLFRDPINPSMDGNTVEMAVEQMEFSENVMRYQTTLSFLNKRISGLMSAIRGE
jgi:flagellar basal-body rod protein FlgB